MPQETQPLIVLAGLGKNIGANSTPEKIRRDRDHLSGDSRINAIATADIVSDVFRPDYIIFSSGYTSGKSVPSEATAMSSFLSNNTKRFPDIPEEIPVILEEESLDTASNADEVAKIVSEIEKNTNRKTEVVLVTTRYHLKNAAKIFRDAGINVWDWDGYASDEVVAKRAKKPEKFLENYRKQKRIKGFMGENMRESVRKIILNSGPLKPLGNWLIRKVTSSTRK